MKIKHSDNCNALQNSPDLQLSVRQTLISALIAARNAAVLVGDDAITATYREKALEEIYQHLAFAVPEVVMMLEVSKDRETDFTVLCQSSLWLGEKSNIPNFET